MGSSKSAQALITRFNYEERGMSAWLIKPAIDVRDGATTIRSRVGLENEATPIQENDDIFEERDGVWRATCPNCGSKNVVE